MATYTVNPAGVAKARELIAAKRYVLDSDWSDAQPSADDENAFLTRKGGEAAAYEEYGAWHLGLTEGPADDTKARYAFGYGDFTRLHRSALIACVFRASQWRHKDVELAAHDLLQELDAATGLKPKGR